MLQENKHNILVIPVTDVAGIVHLLDIVAQHGTNGKKTETYWILSTDTLFNEDGSGEVRMYNQMMAHYKAIGYDTLQIIFNI